MEMCGGWMVDGWMVEIVVRLRCLLGGLDGRDGCLEGGMFEGRMVEMVGTGRDGCLVDTDTYVCMVGAALQHCHNPKKSSS